MDMQPSRIITVYRLSQRCRGKYHKKKHFCLWNIFEDMCRMDSWSF